MTIGKRILVGFLEALPAPETIFSLKAAGHEVTAFTRAGSFVPARSLPVADIVELPTPETDAEACVEALAAFLNSNRRPDIVFAIDDTALWLVDRALASTSASISVASATGDRAVVALDKTLQLAQARAAGFAVPDTKVITTAADLRTIDTFPAIVKPAMAIAERDGHLTKGSAHYLLSREELDTLAKNETALAYPLLAQPLVAGVGEGVFGFATADGVINWSGHQRVRMMNPHGSGSSACRSIIPSNDIKAAAERMMMTVGWRGPFMIELLRDAEGTMWFMELNGRLWGSLALARRAGYEYPAWAVAQAGDPAWTPEKLPPPKPRTMRHLGRDIMHLAFVLRGPKTPFHAKNWPSFWRSLAGVVAPAWPSSFYNYAPSAPLFFLRDAIAVVFGHWRRAK